MYDLHLHSMYSDGELDLPDLVAQVAHRGLKGFALTDHNSLAGVAEAGRLAKAHNLSFLEGIEVSARFSGVDIHILGYSFSFQKTVLAAGLEQTRRGYEERIAAMVARCHEAHYSKVALDDILERRRSLGGSLPHPYDVALELQRKEGLSVRESHQLTIKGGQCYVPYGAWAATPSEIIHLIHTAGGLASLAHPGIVEREGGGAIFEALLRTCVAAGLDAIEIYHPFHTPAMIDDYMKEALRHRLLVTGGSDWHGASRFPDNHAGFGRLGVGAEAWQALAEGLGARYA